jgi:hypothetical protein
MKRVIFDFALFFSVLILPWWVSAILLLIGVFIFKKFYEFMVASVIIYSLYSVPKEGIIYSPIFFTLVLIALFILIEYIKERIILYKK